jgi:lipopolysaccharide transport system ATP-binding protein
MSVPVITVENLSKVYRIRHQTERHDTFRDTISGVFKKVATRTCPPKPWRRRDPTLPAGAAAKEGPATAVREDFFALSDVSFEVKQGEVLGIIGRNGAGKSTLLKILSQITEPTKGRVEIYGRVASLLEVGTGFHPELTGRENIFLNGAILGMSRSEIRGKFDQIVDFAGVEKFIDTPVKRYSSGMQVRLAFSVAAHLEPEILVIDEVLAVGDAEFQRRCLGKMRDVAGGGRTVLFVSHNESAVRSLCSQALLLDRGRINQQGGVEDILGAYHGLQEEVRLSSSYLNSKGPEAPHVRRVRVAADTGGFIEVGQALEIEFEVIDRGVADLMLGLRILNGDGTVVAHSSTEIGRPLTLSRGVNHLCCQFPSFLFNVGLYRVEVVLAVRNRQFYEKINPCITFEFTDRSFDAAGTSATEWKGVLTPHIPQWKQKECTDEYRGT